MHEDIVNSPKVTTVTYEALVRERSENIAKTTRIQNLEYYINVMDRRLARYRRSMSVLQATCFIQSMAIVFLIAVMLKNWLRSL